MAETSLCMWSGYFDSIMNAIKPNSNGWDGLSYYFHLHKGW